MRLVLRPKLIMLDEPVGGLAPSEIRMMQVLQELKARCTLFVIEHTMRVIRELADRVVVLGTGEKIADGTQPNPERSTGYRSIPGLFPCWKLIDWSCVTDRFSH